MNLVRYSDILQLDERMIHKHIVVILANLGTPDAPTPSAVRKFLREFLSDTRVINIPRALWWWILNLFVLPFRPKRVAEAYASIWEQDSPMRSIVQQQVIAVQSVLDQQLPHLLETSLDQQVTVQVLPAMTYGNPGFKAVLQQLSQAPPDHIIVLPLFPQYSATSTAPLYDQLSRWIPKQRHLPGLTIVRDYYRHPLLIKALAATVERYRAHHGTSDKLLMSFHGIPKPYADKGDPYPDRCRATAQCLADALHLTPDQWAISFQSRFGRQEWVKPYTSDLLEQWGKEGVQSVQVISPAFSADCLETLEELAVENRDVFLDAGGQSYGYIPALNVEDEHIACLTSLVSAHLKAVLPSI